jgi:TonB-linked SusC/RagA family outer membrane protein
MKKKMLHWVGAVCFTSIHLLSFAQEPAWAAASVRKKPASPVKVAYSEGTPLKAVLKQIQERYKINLLYSDRLVQGLYTDFELANALMEDAATVLKKVLQPLNLDVVKIDKTTYSLVAVRGSREAGLSDNSNLSEEVVSLRNTEAPYTGLGDPEMLVKRNMAAFHAQPDRIIRGRVVSENGEPLVGASVTVKDTKTGMATGKDGEFTLSIPDNAKTLTIHFVGYKQNEVAITASSFYTVRLEATTAKSEEVIVTGIVTRRRESFTGATASFTGEQLKMIGNQNLIQSLRTLDPSFVLIENNSMGSNPNALPEIEIRGKTSAPQPALKDQFSADPNQPLFILDGFETNLRTIVDLDMNRVESVTILKDAASTALYGAKAANGVVVIETKKPVPGTMRLSYTGDFRLETPDLSGYNLMDAEEKLEFERLAGMYTSYAPTLHELQLDLDALYNQRLAQVRRGVNSYWLSDPVQMGFTNGHTLRAEGGDAQMRYAAGLNYRKATGAMKGSGRDTWGGNIDLIYRKNKFNISNKLFVNGFTANESPYGSFATFARANPYYKKYNDNGGVDKYLEVAINRNMSEYKVANPLYNALLNSKDNTKGLTVQNNLQMVVNLQPGVQLQGALQVSKGTSTGEDFVPAENSQFDGASIFEKGRYTNSRAESFSYQGNVMLTYSKLLALKHAITANARAEIQENRNSSFTSVAVGFPAGSNGNPAYAYSYMHDSRPSSVERVYRRNNALLSVNYTYDQRFLFDASYRLDGSTAFGSNKKYSPFWSVGAGWNLHNEAYFKQFSWINVLRLRANTGMTGNQNFGSISSISTYEFDPYINQFGQGVTLLTLGNPDLKWQRTRSTNIGADVTAFGNRLRANLNVFEKNTDPLVVVVELPSSTGIYGYPMNVGTMTTRGAEATLRFSPIYRPQQRMVWTLGFTGSTVKSRYADFTNQMEGVNKQQQESKSLLRYNDGYSPDDIWAVYSYGIDPGTGRELFRRKDGQYTFNYNPADVVVVGNSRPTLEGVLSSNLSLKGFSFGINVRYLYGGDVFNSALFNKVENISLGSLPNNQDKRALYDRWKTPGDISQFKGISITETTPMSSRFVQEENTLTGESISMGYDFVNSQWVKRLGMNTLRINAYMNDIFRASSIRRERGIDYPFTRSVSLSINASF